MAHSMTHEPACLASNPRRVAPSTTAFTQDSTPEDMLVESPLFRNDARGSTMSAVLEQQPVNSGKDNSTDITRNAGMGQGSKDSASLDGRDSQYRATRPGRDAVPARDRTVRKE